MKFCYFDKTTNEYFGYSTVFCKQDNESIIIIPTEDRECERLENERILKIKK